MNPDTVTGRLVQTLPPGPVDVVGDVHGEIDALENVLTHLAAADRGKRFLVFVGDLVDRGPDSPAVVARVQALVDAGRAICLLGNHELNLLLGDEKQGNHWFYDTSERADDPIVQVPVQQADAELRESLLAFFRRLPLAAVREDLRIVHACWQHDVQRALADSDAPDALTLYREHERRIRAELEAAGVTDSVAVELAHQNQNPVKVVTSGLEERTDRPFEAGGRRRQLQRVRWWNDYTDHVACVFGHYSRPPVRVDRSIHRELGDTDPYATLGPGAAICIDYGVGHRWRTRAGLPADGRPPRRLAALRWPEQELLFDDGQRVPLETRV